VKCPRLSAQTLTFTVVDYLKLPTFQARRITANAVIVYPRKSNRHPALRESALACRFRRIGDTCVQIYEKKLKRDCFSAKLIKKVTYSPLLLSF
jgi:hypothetical protein